LFFGQDAPEGCRMIREKPEKKGITGQMSREFSEAIKQLRTDKGISQAQLAEQVFVTRSTIARWENGSRLPDTVMISRLARSLGVDSVRLYGLLSEEEKMPNIIMLDDESIILTGGLPVLEEVFPDAIVTGFTKPSEAIEYARSNRVSLAFLDIEMGPVSGMEICRELKQIDPDTNVIFLTAYADYSLNAWDTGASGFLLKPVTAEGIRKQLERLKYPMGGQR